MHAEYALIFLEGTIRGIIQGRFTLYFQLEIIVERYNVVYNILSRKLLTRHSSFCDVRLSYAIMTCIIVFPRMYSATLAGADNLFKNHVEVLFIPMYISYNLCTETFARLNLAMCIKVCFDTISRLSVSLTTQTSLVICYVFTGSVVFTDQVHLESVSS